MNRINTIATAVAAIALANCCATVVIDEAQAQPEPECIECTCECPEPTPPPLPQLVERPCDVELAGATWARLDWPGGAEELSGITAALRFVETPELPGFELLSAPMVGATEDGVMARCDVLADGVVAQSAVFRIPSELVPSDG